MAKRQEELTEIEAMASVIGRRVRYERLKRGWSEAELAVYAGLSIDSVRNLEKGRNGSNENSAKLATVQAVARALELKGGWYDLVRADYAADEEAMRVMLHGFPPDLHVVPALTPPRRARTDRRQGPRQLPLVASAR